MPEKIIELETKMGKGWKVTAQVREHTLVIDQPTAGNEGANPLETFLFSLGAVFLPSPEWWPESRKSISGG